jgi:hypothetical protein
MSVTNDQFEPTLSNFLDESFSYFGRGKTKKVKEPKISSGTPKDPKITSDKLQKGADMVTSLGGIISQLPKNQAKQEIKAACGRRPLLKKKRATWDKCAADYIQSKNAPPLQQQDTNQSPQQNNNTPPTDEKKFYQKPLFIVGVSVVVLVGGFLAFKFFKKTPVQIT